MMVKKTALAVALLIALYSTCYAQSTLRGVVHDESAKPVQGASVQLLNTRYTTGTDSAGMYLLQNVPSGVYDMLVSMEGYSSYITTLSVPGDTGNGTIVLQKNKTLETVVVTTNKREELPHRVAASVTTLSGAQADAYRLWNASELTAVSANLYAAHPGDNRNVTSLRGVVNSSYEQAVATYVDGVSQFGLDTYIPQLFDVERIEIIKGPQGNLYGRNASGGVVNIITRRPGNKRTGFAEISIGAYGRQRVAAGVRQPLIKDKLYFGAAALFDRFNGYYTNSFNNTRYDPQSNITGNYFLRFQPGNAWTFNLNVKHAANRNTGAFPLVMGVDEAFGEPYRLSQNAVAKMMDNVFNASLSIQYTRRVVFTAQTSWQSNYRYYKERIDADFSALDAITIFNDYGKQWNNVKVLTQEFNIRSAGDKRFGWQAGSYLFGQWSPVKQATVFGSEAQLIGAPDRNFALINTTEANSRGAALYGRVQYAVSKKIQVTGGLRYDTERRAHRILGEYQKDTDPDPSFAFRSDTTAHADFSAWSPGASISVFPSANNTLYASYSRGYRAGGLTPLSSDPSQPALFPYKPEYSNNLELGWKHFLPGKGIVLNVALFYTVVNEVQVPSLVLPDAVTLVRNTGKMVSKGFETEFRSLLFNKLSIDHSFGFTDARYRTLKLAQNGSEVNLEGKRQVFTPRITSMLGIQFRQLVHEKIKLAVVARGEWKFLGTQYFDLPNTIRQGAYHLINSRAGLVTSRAELFYWMRNIGGTRYIAYAYDFGAIHLGNPATEGVTVRVNF